MINDLNLLFMLFITILVFQSVQLIVKHKNKSENRVHRKNYSWSSKNNYKIRKKDLIDFKFLSIFFTEQGLKLLEHLITKTVHNNKTFHASQLVLS